MRFRSTSSSWATLVDSSALFSELRLFARTWAQSLLGHPSRRVSNAAELLHRRPDTRVESWEGDAAENSEHGLVPLLVRDHRFLGIADRQLDEYEGVYARTSWRRPSAGVRAPSRFLWRREWKPLPRRSKRGFSRSRRSRGNRREVASRSMTLFRARRAGRPCTRSGADA